MVSSTSHVWHHFQHPMSLQSHAGCTEHVLLCKDPEMTTGRGGEGSLQGECSVDVLAHGLAFGAKSA